MSSLTCAQIRVRNLNNTHTGQPRGMLGDRLIYFAPDQSKLYIRGLSGFSKPPLSSSSFWEAEYLLHHIHKQAQRQHLLNANNLSAHKERLSLANAPVPNSTLDSSPPRTHLFLLYVHCKKGQCLDNDKDQCPDNDWKSCTPPTLVTLQSSHASYLMPMKTACGSPSEYGYCPAKRDQRCRGPFFPDDRNLQCPAFSSHNKSRTPYDVKVQNASPISRGTTTHIGFSKTFPAKFYLMTDYINVTQLQGILTCLHLSAASDYFMSGHAPQSPETIILKLKGQILPTVDSMCTFAAELDDIPILKEDYTPSMGRLHMRFSQAAVERKELPARMAEASVELIDLSDEGLLPAPRHINAKDAEKYTALFLNEALKAWSNDTIQLPPFIQLLEFAQIRQLPNGKVTLQMTDLESPNILRGMEKVQLIVKNQFQLEYKFS